MDWKTILERDGPAAWRAAYRLLGNTADADDCLQDAALTAVKLSRQEPIANVRALLTRLASARAMDRLRQRYRSRIQHDTGSEVAAVADPLAVNDATQYQELQSQLRRALTQLSEEQATAFALCALEGWTYADAGSELRTTANAIGILVHRARQQLRQLLKDHAPIPVISRRHS